MLSHKAHDGMYSGGAYCGMWGRSKAAPSPLVDAACSTAWETASKRASAMDHDSGPVGDFAAAYCDSAAAIVRGCPSESACHRARVDVHVTDHEGHCLWATTAANSIGWHAYCARTSTPPEKHTCSMHCIRRAAARLTKNLDIAIVATMGGMQLQAVPWRESVCMPGALE